MGIKEIDENVENLIEKGEVAERRVKICEDSVAASKARVDAAERQLAAASKKDRDGNPAGDVKAAEIELWKAQHDHAAGQSALSSAIQEAEEIKRQKETQIEDIRDSVKQLQMLRIKRQ